MIICPFLGKSNLMHMYDKFEGFFPPKNCAFFGLGGILLESPDFSTGSCVIRSQTKILSGIKSNIASNGEFPNKFWMVCWCFNYKLSLEILHWNSVFFFQLKINFPVANLRGWPGRTHRKFRGGAGDSAAIRDLTERPPKRWGPVVHLSNLWVFRSRKLTHPKKGTSRIARGELFFLQIWQHFEWGSDFMTLVTFYTLKIRIQWDDGEDHLSTSEFHHWWKHPGSDAL